MPAIEGRLQPLREYWEVKDNDKLTPAELYLKDLGTLLLEDARAARQARDAAPASNRDFEQGRLLGYNEVISTMQLQAKAFGIPLEEIGLASVDPDKELV